jgi:tetratricopeptide (TPR) repeat protein
MHPDPGHSVWASPLRIRDTFILCMLLVLVSGGLGCAGISGNPEQGIGPAEAADKKKSASGTVGVEQPVPPEADRLFKRALKSQSRGDLDRAIAELEQVTQLAPDLSVPYNDLGVLYKRKGLLDKAIEAYQQAIRTQPEYGEAFHNLGIAYREKGLFQESEEAYRNAIRVKPDLAPAYLNLGVLYELYLDRPEEAIRRYREYLKWGGINPQVEIWISSLEQRTGATRSSPNAGGNHER